MHPVGVQKDGKVRFGCPAAEQAAAPAPETKMGSTASKGLEQLRCPICLDHPQSMQEWAEMDCCGKGCCVECMATYVQSSMKDRNLPVGCPECREPVPVDKLNSFLGADDFEKLLDLSLLVMLEKEANVAFCPTPDCGYAFIRNAESETRGSAPRSDNDCCPKCKRCCLWCLGPAHPGLSCEQAAQTTKKDDGDEQLELWRKAVGAKQCPGCRAVVEKIAGCDFMTCRCGICFCYRCNRQKRCTDPHYCQQCVEDNMLGRPHEEDVRFQPLDPFHGDPGPAHRNLPADRAGRIRWAREENRERALFAQAAQEPEIRPAEMRRRWLDGADVRQILGRGTVAFALELPRPEPDVAHGYPQVTGNPQQVHERLQALAHMRQQQREYAEELGAQVAAKARRIAEEQAQEQQQWQQQAQEQQQQEQQVRPQPPRRQATHQHREALEEARRVRAEREAADRQAELDRDAEIRQHVEREAERLRVERARHRRALPTDEELQRDLAHQVAEKARRQQEAQEAEARFEARIKAELRQKAAREESERAHEMRHVPHQTDLQRELAQQIAEKEERLRREQERDAELEARIREERRQEVAKFEAEQRARARRYSGFESPANPRQANAQHTRCAQAAAQGAEAAEPGFIVSWELPSESSFISLQ